MEVDAAQRLMRLQQALDPSPQFRVVAAGSPEALKSELKGDALIVETANPDSFYARLTEVAASGEAGSIEEVTSPDDNLQAVFQYLVKS